MSADLCSATGPSPSPREPAIPALQSFAPTNEPIDCPSRIFPESLSSLNQGELSRLPFSVPIDDVVAPIRQRTTFQPMNRAAVGHGDLLAVDFYDGDAALGATGLFLAHPVLKKQFSRDTLVSSGCQITRVLLHWSVFLASILVKISRLMFLLAS